MYRSFLPRHSVDMDQNAPAVPAAPAVPTAPVSARAARLVDAAPPHLYFLVSAIFHYLGPSFAVLLFARVEVLGVAWLRIVSAAVILPSGDVPGRPSRRWIVMDGACC